MGKHGKVLVVVGKKRSCSAWAAAAEVVLDE